MDRISPRRQAEVRQFATLCNGVQTITSEYYYKTTIPESQLESLGILRSRELDIDDPSPLDLEPRFFRACCSLGKKSADEASALLRDGWCGQVNTPPEHDDPEWAATSFSWEWRTEGRRDGYLTIPFSEGALYGPYRTSPDPEYATGHVLIPRDDATPHTVVTVCDETVSPEDEMLVSEIDGALRLVKERLRAGLFTNHHTKPVLILSFQSETHARITQAYYDAKIDKLVLRQSRLLDLRGDEPPADAYILLSWLLNTPVGDTMFATPIEETIYKERDGHNSVEQQTLSPQKSVTAGGH